LRLFNVKRKAFSCFLPLAIALQCADAQVLAPVTEIVAQNSEDEAALTVESSLKTGPATAEDTFSSLQMLRSEVQELRGLVETLEFRLQQVKQQQLDDYLDLDRRISGQGLNRNVDSKNPDEVVRDGDNLESQSDNSKIAIQSPSPRTKFDENVKQDYDRASTLLLKDRDMEGAVEAFKNHIDEYPNSPYVANASYWLGEIYLLRGLQEDARQEFIRIVQEHPGHSKEMDARFKLGKIYFELGDKELAREYLEAASKTSGAVSIKAKSYLESNF
jgi:tol-pal system protein YbgF